MVHILLFLSLWFLHLIGVFGVQTNEVKSVSVMEGYSVTLPSDVKRLQKDDQIGWSFGGMRIARIKRAINNNPMYEDNVRFTGRLQLDNQTGSLTIINIRTNDSGPYKLTTTIGNEESVRTFSVTVHETITSTSQTLTQKTTSQSPEDHGSLTVGISAATAGFLFTVAVGIFCLCQKKRKTEQAQTNDEEITYADPTFHRRQAQKANVKQEDEVVYAGVVARR